MVSIKDKIKQIKFNRLKPGEIFLMGCFVDLQQYVSDNYVGTVFYCKNHDIIFEWSKRDGSFICNYKIWDILKSYNSNLEENKLLIKRMIKTYLKIKNVDINSVEFISSYKVMRDLKPKGTITRYKSLDDLG